MNSYECEGTVELKLKLKTFGRTPEEALYELQKRLDNFEDEVIEQLSRDDEVKQATAITPYLCIINENNLFRVEKNIS